MVKIIKRVEPTVTAYEFHCVECKSKLQALPEEFSKTNKGDQRDGYYTEYFIRCPVCYHDNCLYHSQLTTVQVSPC